MTLSRIDTAAPGAGDMPARQDANGRRAPPRRGEFAAARL